MNYVDKYLLSCLDEDYLKQRYLLTQYLNDLTPFLKGTEKGWIKFLDTGIITEYQYFGLITNIYHNISDINKSLVIKLLFLCERLSFDSEVDVIHDEVLNLIYNFDIRIRMNKEGFDKVLLYDTNSILNKDFYKVRNLLKELAKIFDKRIDKADMYMWMSETTYWLSFVARYIISFIGTKVANNDDVHNYVTNDYQVTIAYVHKRLEEYSRYSSNIIYQTN